ncbi:hypothetical protein ACFW2K_34130 [Streptomyces nigra]
MGGDERAAQGLVARGPRGGGEPGVGGADLEPYQVGGEPLGGDGDAAAQLLADAHHAPGVPGQRLDVGAAGRPDRHGGPVVGPLVETQGHFCLARHRLVEGQVHGPVGGAQRRHVPVTALRAGLLDLLALHLQVPQPDPHRGVGPPDPRQALGALVPGVGGAGHGGRDGPVGLHPVAGEEHAELPADPVLRGRPAVRVEQIALVEHGVGDRADLLEVGVG